MTEREQNIVVGCILGDGFIQATGKRNARLRLEHSQRQKDYLYWKWAELKHLMQDRPKLLQRFNPVWKKTYTYCRCQSHSSPQFGKLRALFYHEQRKRIPEGISKWLAKPLTLAVWFMDDGYYFARDKTAYLYLSPLATPDIKRLEQTLHQAYGLTPKLERKKTGALNFKFSAAATKRLIAIIAPHVITSMRYKIGEEPRID